MSPTSTDVRTLAVTRLLAAQHSGHPVAPVRDLLGTTDIEAAYAVQREFVRRREEAGAVVVGRKIGLTAQAVQRQMGVGQPDFGVLLGDMDVSGVRPIRTQRLLQPKIEAEIAFVLRHDLTEFDSDTVWAAVDYAVAALEIVDSRIADWNITITDTIADNASSGLFVLSETRLGLDEFQPRDVSMRLFRDGAQVSEGTGAACLGDPLAALAWLAETAAAFGDPLRAGQVVLSGALGPMVAVAPGDRFRAEIGALGEVRAEFSVKDES